MINVVKRSGEKEALNVEKFNKVLMFACEGIFGVSASEIALKSNIQFFDKMKTADVTEIGIKAAADLISEETPNYQYVAGRLINYQLRKEVYGQFEPKTVHEHFVKYANKGFYTKELLKAYDGEEWAEFESIIKHERDDLLTYVAMEQMRGKYLIKDRTNGKIFETPQMAFLLISATIFMGYPKETRMQYVKDFYDALSTFDLSLPTPIMAGVRTREKQFSSCVLIETDDSLDSIIATNGAIVKYVSKKAGIGIGSGKMRALSSAVRNGEVSHTGVIPFWKMFDKSVNSCSQGGVRKGSATVSYAFWHREVEDLLVLKNNKGTDDNRIRGLDYCVQLNKLFYERLIQGGNITLFSPSYRETPGLIDAFYEDDEKFRELYEKYEASRVPKKVVKALDLFTSLMQERKDTGRIYIQHIDHCNEHGPYVRSVAPIRMTNLCVAPETMLLTDKGYRPIVELAGTTAICWNGEEFSKSLVRQTGVDQKIITVNFSDGATLDCTPHHEFSIVKDYNSERRARFDIVDAQNLKPGMKLQKTKFPVIEGTVGDMSYPYTNGFYTADGCEDRYQIVYFYGDKEALVDVVLEETNKHLTKVNDEIGRKVIRFKNRLCERFFVPHNMSILTRLKWLAGLFDGDGCVTNNNATQSIQLTSTKLHFLRELKLMLNTLGVASKITDVYPEGNRVMPDGKGGSKEYFCAKTYRILIGEAGIQQLLALGLKTYRLHLQTRNPNREALQYVKVVSVIDSGRTTNTYCINEPKRNMGIFNGVLTRNCVEITEHTKPLQDLNDPLGEIALCTLAAINFGKVNSNEDMERIANLLVRALDAILDYQEYPVKAAENSTLNRRHIGIGPTNFAYWLVKNGLNYQDIDEEGLKKVHALFESYSYYIIKASVDLAEEKGPCPLWKETKWAEGIFPIDTYKKDVDELVKPEYTFDWETLRCRSRDKGIRNSTLMSGMPTETSSQISNSTNGVEPPRSLVSFKQSKDGTLKQVVPEIRKYKNKYDLLWEQKSPRGYLNIMAVIQKFFDQAISVNTSYNPAHFPEGKIPMSVLLGDLLYAYKYGTKNLYYCNINDQAGEMEIINSTEEDCESCKV